MFIFEDPPDHNLLAEDPNLIPNAIEELLRYEPPSPGAGPHCDSRRRAPRPSGPGREHRARVHELRCT